MRSLPRRPEGIEPLHDPVLVAAFEGWNDAGDAATGAVEHLEDVWQRPRRSSRSTPTTTTTSRSTGRRVSLVDGTTRRITWPTHALLDLPAAGGEPRRRPGARARAEHALARLLRGAARRRRELGVRTVVTLGALLADSPHTRPVPVNGTASDPRTAEALGLERSRYEGPTGIVGVFQDACGSAGVSALSFWAAVPHYVSSPPCPKATVALLRRVEDLLDVPVPLGELPERPGSGSARSTSWPPRTATSPSTSPRSRSASPRPTCRRRRRGDRQGVRALPAARRRRPAGLTRSPRYGAGQAATGLVRPVRGRSDRVDAEQRVDRRAHQRGRRGSSPSPAAQRRPPPAPPGCPGRRPARPGPAASSAVPEGPAGARPRRASGRAAPRPRAASRRSTPGPCGSAGTAARGAARPGRRRPRRSPETKTRLPRDLLIFSPSSPIMPACTEARRVRPGCPVSTSACDADISWCGKTRSRAAALHVEPVARAGSGAIAVHSTCQPGRPRPSGESQAGSPAPLAAPEQRRPAGPSCRAGPGRRRARRTAPASSPGCSRATVAEVRRRRRPGSRRRRRPCTPRPPRSSRWTVAEISSIASTAPT